MSNRLLVVALVALGGMFTSLQPASAQPGGGRGGFGGFGGGGFGGLLGQINDENVQKDLELLDDQVTKLRDLQRKIGESMGELFQGGGNFRDLSEEERRTRFEELRTKADAKRKEIEKEAESILLPSQVERLKQINVQSQLRFRGAADVLATLKTEADLSDADIEAMKKAGEEAQVELQKKTAKLQEEAREKVFSVLTPAQREKVKKLIGAKIEFSPPQFGRGGGQPGQGGRGGNRPGN